MNKVVTLVFDTLEADLDPILAAAINEINKAGHTLKAVRVADDSGETVVAPNTVAGVVPPPSDASATVDTPEDEPPAEEEPAPAPVDTPVDPTQPEDSTASTN